jgi:hypothetical protein
LIISLQLHSRGITLAGTPALIAAADTVVAQAGSVYATLYPRGSGFWVLYKSIIGDGVPSDMRWPTHDCMIAIISCRFVICVILLLF